MSENANQYWVLPEEPPEPAELLEPNLDAEEPGRAYDERGNVRPADARYTEDPASDAAIDAPATGAAPQDVANVSPSSAPVSGGPSVPPEEKSATAGDSTKPGTEADDE